MKRSMLIPSVLLTAAAAMANGGPVETSPVLGAGEPGPADFVKREVELVSEDLVFTPGMNYVKVNVTYMLYNYGEDLETGYCFPVTALSNGGDDYYCDTFDPESDVRSFTIIQDGTELDFQVTQVVDSTETIDEYGWDSPLITHYYTTTLNIPEGDTTTVQVSYEVRATYEDFETSKDYFPSHQDRRFSYDLSPAAWWGRGTAGEFTMTLDLTELHAMGGDMQDIPPEGNWQDENSYLYTAGNLRLNDITPVQFSWESRAAASSIYLEEHAIPPGYYTVTASSSLEGYGTENLIDGDPTTAWCEAGEGIEGAWIEITMDPEMEICWVGIIPGYAKNEYTYTANARPIEADIDISYNNDYSDSHDYTEIPVIFWESMERGPIFNMFRGVFNRGESYPINTIRITFTEAIPGTEFEDLCVSEVVVGAWNYPEW